MKTLQVGANTAVAAPITSWVLEVGKSAALGDYASVAFMPVNDQRVPKGRPVLAHEGSPWLEMSGDADRMQGRLSFRDLAMAAADATRLLMVLYVYGSAGPASELRSLHLRLDDAIDYRLDLMTSSESAIIIGEYYLRNGQWKFRALSEGSAYGLAAFGRRISMQVNEDHPTRQHGRGDSGASGAPGRGASGTGFAVSPTHVMTCAHVIEDMDVVHISSFDGRHPAETVLMDRVNDIALLRIIGAPPLVPVKFKSGRGIELGDTIVTVGFPLAGLAGSGAHVTHGGVSALFGLHNDASRLQFTAPIQPGSSGSPLFDGTGAVVGMVTSSVTDAQNMNFAVKTSLCLSFLEGCRQEPVLWESGPRYSTPDMAKMAQPSLWRIEAYRN